MHSPNHPNAGPKKTEYMKVRVSPELRERIERAAERDGRTMAGYVRQRLRRTLDIEEQIYDA